MSENDGKPTTKRGLSDIAKGGNWFDASTLPPRGKEYTVVGTDWEPNYAKDALVPVLLLDNGTEKPSRFKVTNRQSAAKLSAAGVSDDLAGAEGALVYLIPVPITVGGKPYTVGQIAEVTRPKA